MGRRLLSLQLVKHISLKIADARLWINQKSTGPKTAFWKKIQQIRPVFIEPVFTNWHRHHRHPKSRRPRNRRRHRRHRYWMSSVFSAV